MADQGNFEGSKKQYVWVKDKAGNEYICSLDGLKDPKNASKDELENCLDDASSAGGVNPRGG